MRVRCGVKYHFIQCIVNKYNAGKQGIQYAAEGSGEECQSTFKHILKPFLQLDICSHYVKKNLEPLEHFPHLPIVLMISATKKQRHLIRHTAHFTH